MLVFPFDIATCSLQLSSFGNNIATVRYIWDVERTKNGVFVDPINNDADHIGFDLLPTEHLSVTCEYGPDNFSCLKALVSLKRNYSSYILQIYIPALLLVILSWLTFWVNINATPARASLSVTTVLSILTLATRNASDNEKHVSGKVTALDIYVYVCFAFVVTAMLEFSLSDFVSAKFAAKGSVDVLECRQGFYKTKIKLLISDGESVNKVARILVPLSFLLFNIIYWLILWIAINNQQ